MSQRILQLPIPCIFYISLHRLLYQIKCTVLINTVLLYLINFNVEAATDQVPINNSFAVAIVL